MQPTVKPRTEAAIGRLVRAYPRLTECRPAVVAACEMITAAFRAGHQLLICGNGGSAADANHIAGELAKSFRLRRRPDEAFLNSLAGDLPGPSLTVLANLNAAVPALSLVANTALMTAIENDLGGELVFAQQVMAHGCRGDIVLGLTTSGSSKNVVRAFQTARLRGLSTICLTGAQPPVWLHELVNVVVGVPALETAEVQEMHLPVYHTICEYIESELFDE